MINPEANLHQALAFDMQAVLRQRVEQAVPIDLLSSRGNKVLEVMQEQDGQQFVTRSYTKKAVQGIEVDTPSLCLDFPEAWASFQSAWEEVGLPVVNSALIRGVNGYSYVAVTEYLKDARPLKDATTETKQQVAHSLGRLVYSIQPLGFLPSITTLHEDLILVTGDERGEETPVVVDLDPYVEFDRFSAVPERRAARINQIRDLLWDKWCNENERRAVFVEFINALGPLAADEIDRDFSGPVSEAFQIAHFMSNDTDLRDQVFVK